MPGTVVTFYSYKGGVGRSFVLANIAVLLARWGHRVLCVDWDLEAPGLHEYFRPMTTAPPAGGVVDLVGDFLAGRTRPADHAIRLSSAGELDFLAAGREGVDYIRQVQEIDWQVLYEMGFGEYLERCREQWIADYDYVLLDSRTGVSDIGGICTAHLPDRLVVLFTANKQSIRGAVDIARRANAARDRMPYDRAQLTVLPVLSRFDTREEYDRSEDWRRICSKETETLFHNWLHQTVETELIFRHLTLPYVSYWSFGEQLPVRSEANPSADQIGFALETVAAVIAQHFDRTDLLAENRDAYVAAARSGNREFVHDVRVSTRRSTLDLADELISELGELGVRAERSLSGDRSLLGKSKDNARHLCLIVDGEVSRWQSAEVELFLHRTLGQDRRVIPVLTQDAQPNELPGYVGNLRYVRFGPSRGPAEVARGLADQLNGVTTPIDTGEVDLVGILWQAARALLRAPLWELVDEIVHALLDAVRAQEDVRVQDLAADLALAIRPRSVPGGSQQHVAAPAAVQTVIESIVRLLDARTKDPDFNGFSSY
jgi:MinD-like ATPase involved in chromosome partitioning or flagellar assembly